MSSEATLDVQRQQAVAAFCAGCGARFPDEARFCMSCGQARAGGPSTAPPAPLRGNGIAIAAFVLGLAGTAAGLIPLFFWVAVPSGVAAVALGAVGRRRARRGARTGGKGTATAGVVLGLAATGLGIAGAVLIGGVVHELDRTLTASGFSTETTSGADGVRLVPDEMEPAVYRSTGGGNCYWERLRGFSGELDDIVANGIAAGPVIVRVAGDDAGFRSQGCDDWAPLADLPVAPADSFGDGIHSVRHEIEPGTYRAAAASEQCYWARLDDFTGDLEDLPANGLVAGQAVVTVAATDVGFESTGCGTWTRVSDEAPEDAPMPPPTTSPSTTSPPTTVPPVDDASTPVVTETAFVTEPLDDASPFGVDPGTAWGYELASGEVCGLLDGELPVAPDGRAAWWICDSGAFLLDVAETGPVWVADRWAGGIEPAQPIAVALAWIEPA